MTTPMPADAPDLMDRQAERTDLQWVAMHLLLEHARGAYPFPCLCATCRAALRWIPMPAVTPGTSQRPAFYRPARR